METFLAAFGHWIWGKLQNWGLGWIYRKILAPACAWITGKLRPTLHNFYRAIGLIPEPAPRTITRYKLNFRIHPRLEERYLGRKLPSRVVQTLIDISIRGPFCPECHHEMVLAERNRGEQVRNQCVFCGYLWGKEPTTRDLRRFLYNDLDAEFSKTGKIADK